MDNMLEPLERLRITRHPISKCPAVHPATGNAARKFLGNFFDRRSPPLIQLMDGCVGVVDGNSEAGKHLACFRFAHANRASEAHQIRTAHCASAFSSLARRAGVAEGVTP